MIDKQNVRRNRQDKKKEIGYFQSFDPKKEMRREYSIKWRKHYS